MRVNGNIGINTGDETMNEDEAIELMNKIKTANDLINEFIDTKPEFMKNWPLKSRFALRLLCDKQNHGGDAMNIFFTAYSFWLVDKGKEAFKK